MRAYGPILPVPHISSGQRGIAIAGHLEIENLFSRSPRPFVPGSHGKQRPSRSRTLPRSAFIDAAPNRAPYTVVDVGATLDDHVLPRIVLHDQRIPWRTV